LVTAVVLAAGAIAFGQEKNDEKAKAKDAKAKPSLIPGEIDPSKPYAAPDRPTKAVVPKYMESKDAVVGTIPVNRAEVTRSMQVSPIYTYAKHRDYPGEVGKDMNAPLHQLMFRPNPLYGTTPYYDRGIANRSKWESVMTRHIPIPVGAAFDSAPVGDYTPFHQLYARSSPPHQTNYYYDRTIAKRETWAGNKLMFPPSHHYFENDNNFIPGAAVDRKMTHYYPPFYGGSGSVYRPAGSYRPETKGQWYYGY
jgi:hypothetical protein